MWPSDRFIGPNLVLEEFVFATPALKPIENLELLIVMYMTWCNDKKSFCIISFCIKFYEVQL